MALLDPNRSSSSYFDPNHPKYRSICRRVHCRRAIYIVLAAELVLLLINLIVNASYYGATISQHNDTGVGYLIWAVVILIAVLIVDAILYVGLRNNRSTYLMPHFIASYFLLLSAFAFIVVLIIVLIVLAGESPSDGRERSMPRNSAMLSWKSLQLALMIVLVPLEAWVLSVIQTMTRFLRDQRAHLTLIAEPRVIYGSMKDIEKI